ncbi:hypothetical protein KAH37_04525 [bacterium]|nr:hypothetical protein [bacterium]
MSTPSTKQINIVSLFEEGFVAFKQSWKKSVPFGILALLPLAILMWSPLIGSVAVLLFQGPLLLLAIEVSHTDKLPQFKEKVSSLFSLFENGFILTVILVPLFSISLLLVVIPAVIVISLFLFSGSLIMVDKRFAIDALMESVKLGEKHRLALVFLSFIMLSSFAILFVFTESIPIFFAIGGGFLLSYELAVVVAAYNRLLIVGTSDEDK